MSRAIVLLYALCMLLISCKEQKMIDGPVFPPMPVAIPLPQSQIFHLFPVLREKSIGIAFGETWAIAGIREGQIDFDLFPEKEFSIPTARALPQRDSELLYVMTPKSVDLLDWDSKTVIASFTDNSRTIANGLDKTKIINYEKGIAISVFNYDGDDEEIERSFVIDNIHDKRRIREIHIPDYARQFPVYFTPSYVIYRRNWQVSWQALDNDLCEVTHPLVDLLNKDPSDSVFAAVHDNMYISEELKQALIISFSRVADRDMLFLVRWYAMPEVIPIPIDTAAIAGGRRLMKTPNQNAMSPSGKWVYFSTDGGENLDDTHYLVYLDPALPNGFLPPFKLSIEGDIEQAGWMTQPEGLVLYNGNALLYYDLSEFEPGK